MLPLRIARHEEQAIMSDYPELETVRIEREGHVAEVILNRPEKGNAWNPQMFRDQASASNRADRSWPKQITSPSSTSKSG